MPIEQFSTAVGSSRDDRATADGHVGAQAAIAREVATAAIELNDIADVVFAELDGHRRRQCEPVLDLTFSEAL
jgi:hypothetical protein